MKVQKEVDDKKFFDNSRKLLIILIILGAILLISSIAGIIIFRNSQKATVYEDNTVISVKYDKDENLPIIAHSIMQEYLSKVGMKKNINNKPNKDYITKFQITDQKLISSKDGEGTVGVRFNVKMDNLNKLGGNSWGIADKNGLTYCNWILKIKKTDPYTYTLEGLENTSDSLKNLSINEKQSYDPKAAAEKIAAKDISYKIQRNIVKVTYDGGKTWKDLPVSSTKLITRGEAVSNKTSLQKGSYYITNDKTAFVYGENQISVLISNDKGTTWNNYEVGSDISSVRAEYIGFTSKNNGYIVASGDRTMSSETKVIYHTKDGGKTWQEINNANGLSSRVVIDASFITDKIGFMSFGPDPKTPEIYRTEDGGYSWNRITLTLPADYEGKYTTALYPYFDGAKGSIIVTQGYIGDSGTGRVARFISNDYGATWKFDTITNMNDALNK